MEQVQSVLTKASPASFWHTEDCSSRRSLPAELMTSALEWKNPY